MTVHLVKLCVGADSVDDLRHWIEERLAEAGEHVHTTRQTPRRDTGGASLYWVIRGVIQVRQRLLAIRPVRDEDGVPRCELVLDPALVLTAAQPRRPFQGWRYLEAEDAPRDLGAGEDAGEMAPAMRRALAELKLI